MILEGSPQTGFLIKIKANVTKKRQRLPSKASRLRTEMNVHLKKWHTWGGRKGCLSFPLSPSRLPRLLLSRELVSAGKQERVCNEHFIREMLLHVKETQPTLEYLRGPHLCKCFTQSASQCVPDAHLTEWNTEVQRGRSHFHHLLLRVSQRSSSIPKLAPLALPR